MGGRHDGICPPGWVRAAFGSRLAGQSGVLVSPVQQPRQVQAFVMPWLLAASQVSDTTLSPLPTAAARHRAGFLVVLS